MNAKIKAAHLLMKCGKKTIISSYKKSGLIQDILANQDIGTLFFDPSIEDNWKGKRRWIAIGRHLKGKIMVDDGAVEKLTKKGSSLLAKGIIGIEGHFEMGDLVEIAGAKGTFAQGLTHFSSKDLEKIKGVHSSEFFQILGRNTFQTVIHRNNLVLIT
jgi:glutamate 5-kinase